MPQQKQSRSKAPFPSEADLHTWAAELDVVGAKLAPRFERAEPRQRVLAYLTGLLSNAERKNSWQLATGNWRSWRGRTARTGCSGC